MHTGIDGCVLCTVDLPMELSFFIPYICTLRIYVFNVDILFVQDISIKIQKKNVQVWHITKILFSVGATVFSFTVKRLK